MGPGLHCAHDNQADQLVGKAFSLYRSEWRVGRGGMGEQGRDDEEGGEGERGTG